MNDSRNKKSVDEFEDIINSYQSSGNEDTSEGSDMENLIPYRIDYLGEVDEDDDEDYEPGKICQWTTNDDCKFFPTGKTVKILPPGMFIINEDPQNGIFFERVEARTQGLLALEGTSTSEVIKELIDFWNKEEKYRKHNIPYKRGMLFWGPAGSGKSSLIQLIVKDVVDREGVCLIFENPYTFKKAMRRFRDVQKDTPVVVIMEDIDSIIDEYPENDILNILDGVEKVDKVIFLATTNHPEKLGTRIFNRPSRFDKRFKIGYPSLSDRVSYLKSVNTEGLLKEEEIKKWAKETSDFTFAHLKELFVSVAILGNDYKKALTSLNNMKENPSKEEKKSAGFHIED